MQAAKKIKEIRSDVQFAIVGGGTDLEAIMAYAEEQGVSDMVDFYGRVSDELLLEVLNTCDVCVNPDKPTIMNDLSTMNKIMEYMALKKPIVQFDLKEGRASAAKASLYAKHFDIDDFADKILWLLDHPDEAEQMAAFGHQRVLKDLSWDHEQKHLINVYKKILNV